MIYWISFSFHLIQSDFYKSSCAWNFYICYKICSWWRQIFGSLAFFLKKKLTIQRFMRSLLFRWIDAMLLGRVMLHWLCSHLGSPYQANIYDAFNTKFKFGAFFLILTQHFQIHVHFSPRTLYNLDKYITATALYKERRATFNVDAGWC